MKKSLQILSLALCLMLLFTGTALAQFSDIQGHWAQTEITKWVDRGLINGYSDGTFRPNTGITRAEFAAFANRAFGFTTSEKVTFSDVKATAWYANDVSIAKAAGYITGYSDGSFKPLSNITRQEAAAMISRILKLDPQANLEAASHFADSDTFPAWSKGYIGAVFTADCMKGYSDNTFRGSTNITRAEAVITLDNAFSKQEGEPVVQTSFSAAGIYGPATGIQTIDGNVVISTSGVTLRNTVINGDLLLAQGIGEGNVTLNKVTVTGTTTVKGGGSNSIFLTDCTMPAITVDKEGVRIVASGKTSVKVITLESGSILVEVTTAGAGFEKVVISETLPAGSKVNLSGSFESVTLDAPAEVVISSSSEINTLILNAAAQVTGAGTIKKAIINTSGVEIQQDPEEIELADGVEAIVDGEPVTGEPVSSGGGGGGGGGGTTTAVTAEAITVNLAGSDDNTAEAVLTDGVSAQINLTNLTTYPNTAKISSISITAPTGSTLTTSTVTSDALADVVVSETITNLDNIPISALLGAGNDDVSLSTLRAIFGSWVTVSGELSCSGYGSSNVTLTLNLGDDLGYVANDWVTVNTSGNTVTANIKDSMGGTLLTAIGITDFIQNTMGELPGAVSTNGSTWYDPADQKTQIASAIIALINTTVEPDVTWSTATLNDLVGKTIYFKKLGNDAAYQLEIIA